MAEECTHDCSSCGKSCSDKQKKESFLKEPHKKSSIKKVIAVVRGVSYCATCDGALYKGKTVTAVAGSAAFEEDVALLENFADKLYFVPLYKNCAYKPKKTTTEMFTDGLVRIEGDMRVKKAVFRTREVQTNGVFILKESAPLQVLCGGLKTDGAHVVTDKEMRTNLPGVFAAGDCAGRPYQLAKAAGEGCVAAHSASHYIEAGAK